ncbi:MAG: hypothetical protein KDD42_00830 [Bdellovibrionales bacterium]|nr:hypothetical protein [Bdellovibrionales bacterium]
MRSKIFVVALMLFTFNGCNFVERNTIGLFDSEEPAVDTLGTETASLEEQSDSSSIATEDSLPDKLVETEDADSNIEIVWEIPEEDVDEYIIRYGYTKDSLDFVKRLVPDQIDRVEEENHGTVFHYILEGFPPQKTVYITLESVKEGSYSAPTEVFVVKSDS